MINILSIGIASYNFKMHVPSDVPANGLYIPNQNLKTQEYLNNICKWTSENKMLLNKKKSQAMIFNFTRNFQFSSRTVMDDQKIDVITETRLLGVIVNNKLTWESNTMYLVRRANARMRLLHKLLDFGVPTDDLVSIYILYVRSILEQSCQVWHSSLTLECFQNLERVQKNALKIILQDDYVSYSNALNISGISTLFERWVQLCLKFAKSSLKNQEMSKMFPLNNAPLTMETRFREKYRVTSCRTERFKNSAIPYLQRLLNSDVSKKKV